MYTLLLLLDVALWALLYYLFLRSVGERRNRPFVIGGLTVALAATYLSPLFRPMKEVFGPTLLIPAAWMLLRLFRRMPEYYWTSPFLALYGIYSLLRGETFMGLLSFLLSPVPVLVGMGVPGKVKRYLSREKASGEGGDGKAEGEEDTEDEARVEVSVSVEPEGSGGKGLVKEEDVKPPVITVEVETDDDPVPVEEGKVEAAERSPETEEGQATPSVDAVEGEKDDSEEIERTKEAILSKLSEFGVKGEIVKVWRGPVLTLYEFVPAPGVKVSSVVNREDDLHVSLKKPVRIVAPLPNGNIGIEVPNDRRKVFTFKDAEPYLKRGEAVDVPIGVDVFGKPYIFNLHKAPHVLIGGATGSGKSVLLSTLVLGLIRKNTPETLRLVLIDPKMVELSTFEGLPHLLLPVAKMVPQAVHSLKTVIDIMTERYTLMSSVGARDIEAYNGKARRLKMEPMPYVVVVIDELADLMMLSPKDTVDAIQRIAQLARAVGIHMVVATQRPSVDVVKPVIKANFPTRIALKVASRFDSRTILDRDGAERLLGKGDMLVLTADRHDPVRVHGYYTSHKDIHPVLVSWIAYRLTREWGKEYVRTERFVRRAMEEGVLTALFRDDEPAHDPRFNRLVTLYGEIFGGEDGRERLEKTLKGYYPYSYEDEEEGRGQINLRKLDPLIVKAAEVFQEVGYGSTSLLQRRLGIGYPRAAKIVDQLERLGFLSKAEGTSRPRKLLMSVEELRRIVRG